MSTEIISVILILIAGVMQAEAELIRFTPDLSLFNKAPWWRDNNWKYKSKFLETIMRYMGSFAKDGFHFAKSLSIIFHSIVMGLVIITIMDIERQAVESLHAISYFFLVVALYYTIYGIGFNLRFHWTKWCNKVKTLFGNK